MNRKKFSSIVFLYIIPFALLWNLLTFGHWTVQYKDPSDGIVYRSDDVTGFPFPSKGHFLPTVHPASSDWEYNASGRHLFLNGITALFVGFLCYLPFRRRELLSGLGFHPLWLTYLSIPFLLFSVLWNTDWWWYNDFSIVSYHFWQF